LKGLDYPYVNSLLPNETIQVHSVETQAIIQVLDPPSGTDATARLNLVLSLHGYLVPSTQRSAKMKKVKVRLMREQE
jgi:hypothetical protein